MSTDLPAPGDYQDQPPPVPTADTGASSLEIADLKDRLAAAKKAETSYSLQVMVGMSPIGLYLLVGAILAGGSYLAWLAALVAAFVVQCVRWRRAGAEVERLTQQLELLVGEAED